MAAVDQSVLRKIFEKMCEIRFFEEGLIETFKKGKITCPVYLSTGQEAVSACLGVRYPEHMRVFPQHRGHGVYLAFGGEPVKLRDEILGRTTGCCQGNGGSSDIQCERVEAHHGLLGENVPIAVGYTFASTIPTIAFFGDGALEEDYFFPALGFAVTHRLPVLFLSEDNGLAILTPIKDRRNWDMVKVAAAMGIEAYDCADDPDEFFPLLEKISLPAFINVRTCRHYWHVGIGQDGEPREDRLKELRSRVQGSCKIETQVRERMLGLWREI